MTEANQVSPIDDSWGEASAPSARPSPPAEPTPSIEDVRPAAILRGGARGLEINVHGRATVDAIAGAIASRLAEAPAFFRGSDVRVRVEDGPLAPGCLARIEELAARFELRIVEVGAVRPDPASVPIPMPAPVPVPVPDPVSLVPATQLDLALGLDPIPVPIPMPVPISEPLPAPAPAPEPDPDPVDTSQTRAIVGPVRSGVVLEHTGHLVIFGDVNPGAEIRASGNIVVLGRLRGTAHAGIGRDVGFIMSLRLEPQQLRICRQVARAGDSDKPGMHPEIAHVTGGSIVVERYQGRLPSSLVASI